MLTRSRGNRMREVGMIEGIFCPREVERVRYRKPVMAAKHDWIVFKTRE